MKNEKIIECPFCESNKVEMRIHDSNNYAVTCYDCDARGPSVQYCGDHEEKIREILAIDRWNGRDKLEQERATHEFLLEHKRRRDEHIDCICEKCQEMHYQNMVKRINEKLNEKLKAMDEEDEKIVPIKL